MAEETNPLDDLLIDELKDLYSAEKQIVKALPKMAKAASSPELKPAFEQHLEETEGQVERLEQIFQALGKKPTRQEMQGDGRVDRRRQRDHRRGSRRQRDGRWPDRRCATVEHYEIAAYGTARTYAESSGDTKAAKLLQQTLDEEGATDKKLTPLAESIINVEAAAAD